MACLALLGGAGLGGLAAGFNTRAGLPAGPSATVAATQAEIPPSETVNLRFPANWTEAEGEPAPRTLAFASADGGITLFNPRSFSPIAEAHAAVAPSATEAPVKAKPSAQAAAPKPAAEAAATGPAKIALASASSKPAIVAPKPAPRSNAVLNESQIAGIKKRLALTPDQERYWPAVEAELRKMEYSKKSPQGGSRMASIDMSKMDVEGLKSAGFPLVMSFSDDQRRELKSLAHLLGLESVMAGL
ncbi:MAG TPA: hypothetical protein VMS10_03095 [Methyloceanibacter sp.]|nr:hypothetical protein [Methyloceanibacter sp.]